MRLNRILQGKFLLPSVLFFALYPATLSQIQPDDKNQLIAPLPDPLTGSGGGAIENPEQWESGRRDEVLELFREHVYGRVPDMDLNRVHRVKYLDMNALGGTAVMKEVEVQVSRDGESLEFSILIYLPKGRSGPVPLFLGLNFYGNHTIHPDPSISLTGSWLPDNQDLNITKNRATEESRGVRAHRWPVEVILSRGYGLATVYSGDIDPDFDDGFRNGVHRLAGGVEERTSSSWGTIAAWAWGLSRSMDYFEKDPDIDAGRVAVIGHSRLGKASLWAGAQDERFAMVISNNSGCGGAALSMRAHGETVSRINEVFPHWFARNFRNYNENEAALPVDQHMLMALVAPRPLYVASAVEDDWADPYGEYLSLFYGSRVYGLYGEEVMENSDLPPLDKPLQTGKLGYHIRTGKHDLTLYDWERYLDFADRHLKNSGRQGFVNPASPEWIREHIREGNPRLILTPGLESLIREKLGSGERITTDGFRLLKQDADGLLVQEPLEYKKTGRRILGVSREAIRRLTTLAMVYRLEGDKQYLERLEKELVSICSFDHWNPSHFLDVAEMAAGIALALDWAGEWISPEVNRLAREALIEKALKPGVADSDSNSWIDVDHNWNLVCHGGLALAALAVFEDEPELASRVLHRSVEKIPLALGSYAPGGIYPEGASYWFYATTYLTAVVSAFESAFETDFGFTDVPGVMESAFFSQVLAGPSGDYFNYFDAGLEGYQSLTHFGLLAWFARRSGTGMDLDSYLALLNRELSGRDLNNSSRFFPVFFMNLALMDLEESVEFSHPDVWIGGGREPVVIFRDPSNDAGAFFLAAKGGMAGDNHGNMDAGSFVFELDGVRWSVDPGNQNYHELEQLMGNELWNRDQNSPRWSLLTKNNFGHSTLTVNQQKHRVDARATLNGFDLRDAQSEVSFEMTSLFGNDMGDASRNFHRISGNRLRIVDQLYFSKSTRSLTWQLVTTAEVKVGLEKVELAKEGKSLVVQPVSAEPFNIRVVELSPPPLTFDKNIPGLKRIEFQWDREDFEGDSGTIIVDLFNQT